MSLPVSFLKTIRLVHLYIGVFIAPALLFFAFTGFVQTFSLHETTRGSSYKPPAILVELGQMHKKQTFVVPQKKLPPQTERSTADHGSKANGGTADQPATGVSATPTPAPKPKNLLPMKLFFALVAIGLLLSTLTGLYMSFKYARNTKVVTALLLAGIVIPPLLTLF